MKSCTLLFLFLAFAADAARGLECYYCEYHEGAPLENGSGDPDPGYKDKSCKYGNTPKSDLTKSCDAGEDTCMQVYVEGERDGAQVKSTIRDCSRKTKFPGFETGECLVKEGKELGDLIGIGVPDSFKGTICTCSGEKCNSSSMLKIANGLFVICMLVCQLFNF